MGKRNEEKDLDDDEARRAASAPAQPLHLRLELVDACL